MSYYFSVYPNLDYILGIDNFLVYPFEIAAASSKIVDIATFAIIGDEKDREHRYIEKTLKVIDPDLDHLSESLWGLTLHDENEYNTLEKVKAYLLSLNWLEVDWAREE